MKKYLFLVVAVLCALLPATLFAEELKNRMPTLWDMFWRNTPRNTFPI